MDWDNYDSNFEYKEVSVLLDRLENLVGDVKPGFLSGKVSLDKEDVLDIIQQIRFNLPDEVRRSSMIVEERQRIIDEAKNEADVIRKGAYQHRENIIEHDHITKYAKDKADSMISDAQENAINIQYGAIEYADTICNQLEDKIKDTLEKMYEELKKFEDYAVTLLNEIDANKNELEKMRLKLQELED